MVRWVFQLICRPLCAILIGFCVPSAVAANQVSDVQPADSISIEIDRRDEVHRFISRATREFLAGKVESAILIAQQGLKVAEELLGPEDATTNQVVNTLARLLYQQGRLAESEPLFARAFESNKRSLGDRHLETLASAQDLAFTLSDQAKFKGAETHTRWALAASSKAFGPADKMTLGFLVNLSSILKSAGRYSDAEKALLDVIALAKQNPTIDNDFMTSVHVNMSILYQQQGRFQESEAILLKIIQELEAKGDNSVQMAFRLNNLGVLYSSQEKFAAAAPLFRRVIDISDRTLGKSNQYSATFSANLAAALLNSGQIEEAEHILTEVVRLREAAAGSDDPATISAKFNLANLFDQAGRTAEAEALYRIVLQVRQKLLGAEHPATLDALHNLALVAAKLGRLEEAGRYYAMLVDPSIRNLGPRHPVTMARRAFAIRNRLRMEPNASRSITDARSLVSALRERLTLSPPTAAGDAQHARETRSRSTDFLLLADSAWMAHERKPEQRRKLASEVFVALQDAIAGTASSAIARASVRSIAANESPAMAEMIRLRQDLSDQWAANESLYATAVASASEDGRLLRATLSSQRQLLEEEIGRIDVRLRSEFPGYFAVVRPEPIDVRATQNLLGDDEAVLLAVPSDFGTHLVAISRHGFKWARSDWTRLQLGSAVRRLLWDVGADVGVDAGQAGRWEAEGGPGYPFDRKTAFALYQQLVAPVADILAGKRHLFIASGGSLSSLPFGILVREVPQGQDGDPAALRATQWFADAHTLAVIPSLRSLQLLREKKSQVRTTRNFAGYGDPLLEGRAESRGGRSGKATGLRSVVQPGVVPWQAATAGVTLLKSLARLPGTAVELNNMRAALDAPSSSVHLQREATEGAVKSADLTDIGILTFATHGLMAGELSGITEPGLVFTPPAVPGERDDGLLTASEIATLKLNADWVILSACNTAAGDGSEGATGLSGLARAFFFAGARTLLVSHWPVRDDVAARITVDTIRRQQSDSGLGRAEALQQAIRAIRNDGGHDSKDDTWAHPNAWAPFSLIGDGTR